jgi:GNAT superfamily N-acetyltransferase
MPDLLVATRALTRDEIDLIWTIDRSEVHHHIFNVVDGRLTLVPAYFEIPGWHPETIEADSINLLYLYVSRPARGQGVGRNLFAEAAEAAQALGAKALYISAVPTENTVNFYLRLGAALVADPDPDLLEAEPDDVHLTYSL